MEVRLVLQDNILEEDTWKGTLVGEVQIFGKDKLIEIILRGRLI